MCSASSAPRGAGAPSGASSTPILDPACHMGSRGCRLVVAGSWSSSSCLGRGPYCVRLWGKSHIPARSAATLRPSLGPETPSGLRGRRASSSLPEAPLSGLRASVPLGFGWEHQA